MNHLYKETKLDRATVSQEFRKILGKELAAPEGTHRKVQVLVPLSPEVVVTLEPNAAKAFGANREYKGVPFPPGAQIYIELLPHQEIYAAARDGKAHLGLIIQFIGD